MSRTAQVTRNTLETQISVNLNLDGTGASRLATQVPFLDHMLDQIARHGVFDLEVEARGDLHIDAHHTVEDVGITFGRHLARPSAKRQASPLGTLRPLEKRRKFVIDSRRPG